MTFILIQGQRGCKKATTSTPVISHSLSFIWMGFGVELRLDGVLNLGLILSSVQYSRERTKVM